MTLRRRWTHDVLYLLLPAALAGCWSASFTAKGTLASSGGRLGSWSVTPVACTRSRFLGPIETNLPGAPRSVLTLAWEDPTLDDPQRDVHRPQAGDGPMHLEIAAYGPAFRASLHTLKRPVGLRLDSGVCRTFQLDAQEHAAIRDGGRATLAGHLRMDCLAEGNHVTADITFQHCGF